MQQDVLTPQASFAKRFVLLENLHHGAYSEVWLAEDTRAQIPVALKVLGRESAERVSMVQAFEREWKIARGLNHPHTVRALSWHEGERPAYAMQYIDGTDAADLVGKGIALWGRVMRVIAESLDYWHRKGVVHGDLKPSNLLLDRRGTTYLGDFGTAALIDSDMDFERRGGSAAYSSPEQANGDIPHPADDVFAFAQVVAELATGSTSGDLDEPLPPALRATLAAARGARDSRPSMADIVEIMEAAGIGRTPIDLRATGVNLRRPASSIAGASPSPLPALPHGAFERDVEVPDSNGVSPLMLVAGLAGVLAFGLLFTQGLKWLNRDESVPVEQTLVEEPTAPEIDSAPAPVVDTADARQATDALVSRLLNIDDELNRRAVDLWGGVAYTTGKARYDEGDRAYLARDFVLATERYQDAIDLLEPLLAVADEQYAAAIAEGETAFVAEDPTVAMAAFERALKITPGDVAASVGLERAQRFAEVLALMADGDDAENDGRLADARRAYESALLIDSLWAPAQSALSRVNAAIRADRFASRMSEGFNALDAQQFVQAREAFAAARAVRNDPSVAEALLQVSLAERQVDFENALARAAVSEQSEAWVMARDVYANLLEGDPNLDVAREGLARTQERVDLLARSQAVLDNPDQLAEIDSLRGASRLLSRMNEMSPRGENFAAQIDSLSSLLKAAAIPIPVTLRSDGQTDITVLRVAQLGTFTATELRLRPGLYTVVGSRRGFVDVRTQFRIVSGEDAPAVYVACEQPI